MEAGQVVGLLKFFGNEDFLDMLIAGCFHCTPPEIYRLHGDEGVSDKFESCAFSYRPERGDTAVELQINGQVIEGLMDMTSHNGGEADSWMHCWFTLRTPEEQQGLDSLKSDIERMKKEFGVNYAFIPGPKLKPFISQLQSISDKKLRCSDVAYSADRSIWGNFCKSPKYDYQREYRFLFGECSTHEKEYYVLNDPKGFKEYILKNPDLRLKSRDGTITWLGLNA